MALFLSQVSAQSQDESSKDRQVDLYSWRVPDGKILYGLRIGNNPVTAEALIEDKKYHLTNRNELEKALSQLISGTTVTWHHLSVKGRPSLPPEEIEVETKETALKAGVTLVIPDTTGMEPEYWNQPRGRYDDAVKKLEAATTDSQRMEALRTAAKEAFSLKMYPEAQKYAKELEALASNMKDHLSYGDAVQDYNIILGRIAVVQGDLDSAKGYLIGAGYSPGSPAMNTLGPNMSLAKDLLDKGERSIVLDYLDLCRNFWKIDHGLIDQWINKIKHGETPDFGTNIPK